MRRRRHQTTAELEQGWDTGLVEATGTEKTKQKERPDLDEDLLQLSAGWCNQKPPKARMRGAFRVATANSEEDGELEPRRPGVKSGSINYDAPLFLQAIEKFKMKPTRRAPKVNIGASLLLAAEEDNLDGRSGIGFGRGGVSRGPSAAIGFPSRATGGSNVEAPFIQGGRGGRRKAELEVARARDRSYIKKSEDAAMWDEWQSKWDFIYDFVEVRLACVWVSSNCSIESIL